MAFRYVGSTGSPVGIHNAFVASSPVIGHVESIGNIHYNFSRSRSNVGSVYARPQRKTTVEEDIGAPPQQQQQSGPLQFIRRNVVPVGVAATAALALAAFPPASYAAVDQLGSIETAAMTLSEQLSDSGFYQSFSLVFLSEIGDKTFFVAGLLAAKLSRFVSFVGSLGALAVMTVLAVLIGQVFHAVPAGLTQGLPLDDIAAVAAFLFFGVKILAEAFEGGEGSSFMDEELEDAEETVDNSDTIKKTTALTQIASTFALVFAAEFGDRSFLSTIALSAAQNPLAVAAGSIAAHAIATGIAVVGGAYISKYISEKAISIIGGSLFIVFAITTALGIF